MEKGRRTDCQVTLVIIRSFSRNIAKSCNRILETHACREYVEILRKRRKKMTTVMTTTAMLVVPLLLLLMMIEKTQTCRSRQQNASTFTFTYPLTVGIVGAPRMILQQVSSIFFLSLFSTAVLDLAHQTERFRCSRNRTRCEENLVVYILGETQKSHQEATCCPVSEKLDHQKHVTLIT